MEVSLVLASASVYRKRQLAQLGLRFEVMAADIDETARAGESPEALATRLAREKAGKVKRSHTTAWVVGSDQVCACEGQMYGKPHSISRACDMLSGFAGKTVVFYTALCVITADGQALQHLDETRVRFRNLTTAEVERYVAADQPLDCAGGFKVESRGLSLFQAVESTDPSALMGLPLIQLGAFLRQAGLQVP
jgi:septum formation protein